MYLHNCFAFCIYIKICKHKNPLLSSLELIDAIKPTFTPIPELLELTELFDVKTWMKEIIPPIHDHLKAHQFKFISSKDGVHMFYKQWN